jgi:flagellar hook-length control protein FliK
MTSLPITPPSAARVDAARKGSAPPSGSAGDFAALLDQTSARTASAEGPKTRPAQTEPRRRDAAAPKDDVKGAVVPDAQIAVVDPQAPVAPPAAAPQPAADGTSAEAPQGQTPPVAGETPAAATAVPPPVADPAAAVASAAAAAAVLSTAGTPAPSVPTVGASSAPATAQAAVLTTAPPAASEGPAPAAADAAPTDGKLQIPAELLHAAKGDARSGQGKDDNKDDAAKRELPPAPTLPPTADAAATPAPAAPAATPAPAVAAAAPAPAPTLATQAQPAATALTAVPVDGGGAGGAVLTRASVLQTAERVHELVRIATTRAGNARATLQLRPAELGQVDVHLRTTRDGLVATIAAHDQVGLDALQQAGNELRRSLEDKGVVLHSLDLQLGAGERGFANQGDAREASSGRRGASSTHDLGESPEDDDLTLTTTASSARAGALVDVQA